MKSRYLLLILTLSLSLFCLKGYSAKIKRGQDKSSYNSNTVVLTSEIKTYAILSIDVDDKDSYENTAPEYITLLIAQETSNRSDDFIKLSNIVKNCDVNNFIFICIENDDCFPRVMYSDYYQVDNIDFIGFVFSLEKMLTEDDDYLTLRTNFIKARYGISKLAQYNISHILYNDNGEEREFDLTGFNSKELVKDIIKTAHIDKGCKFMTYDVNESKKRYDSIKNRFSQTKEGDSKSTDKNKGNQRTAVEKKESQNTAKKENAKQNEKINKILGTTVFTPQPRSTHLSLLPKKIEGWKSCKAMSINSKYGIVISDNGEIGATENTPPKLLSVLSYHLIQGESVNQICSTESGSYIYITNKNIYWDNIPSSLENHIDDNTDKFRLISVSFNDKDQWIAVWYDPSKSKYTISNHGCDYDLEKALRTAESNLSPIYSCYINNEGQAAVIGDSIYFHKAPSNLKDCVQDLNFKPQNIQFTSTGLYLINNPSINRRQYLM